jgi:hypothetical protein
MEKIVFIFVDDFHGFVGPAKSSFLTLLGDSFEQPHHRHAC